MDFASGPPHGPPHPPPHGPPMPWWIFPVAFLQGLFMTFSAVVIAYPAFHAARLQTEPARSQKLIALSANLIFTGLGVLIGIFVSGYAPVSVTFPAALAANLLSNMVLQSCLGIAKYTKNMIVGTLVLTAAVGELYDLGAGDIPPDLDRDEVRRLLLTTPSLIFLGVSVFIEVVGVVALLRKCVTDNNAKLFLYALVGSTGTVLNAAVGKVVQLDLSLTTKFGLGVLYVANAVVCLAVAALANGTLEDPSRFVPVSTGMNLVLTCVAGLCIWGDLERLEYPFGYAVIQLLVLLGIYDISTFDFRVSASGFTEVGTNSYGRRGLADDCDVSSIISDVGVRSIGGVEQMDVRNLTSDVSPFCSSISTTAGDADV